MSERYEWVEIVEPRTQDHMYANLMTGECTWQPPPGVKIKKTCDNENQWWELFDANTSRYYYYNATSQRTVWQKPQNCDIIPLAKLQNPKPGCEVLPETDSDRRPQREISTQTPAKKDSYVTVSLSKATYTSPQQLHKYHHMKPNRTLRGERTGVDAQTGVYTDGNDRIGGHPAEAKRDSGRPGRNPKGSCVAEPSPDGPGPPFDGEATRRRRQNDSVAVTASFRAAETTTQKGKDPREKHHHQWRKDKDAQGVSSSSSRCRTAHHSGGHQKDVRQRAPTNAQPPDVLLSPRLHPSRRKENQVATTSFGGGHAVKEPAAAPAPQRSLESPKPANHAGAVPDLHRPVTSSIPWSHDFKRTGMDVSWTASSSSAAAAAAAAAAAEQKPTATRPAKNNYHPSYFQRQDSFPTMRDHGSPSDRAAAYQAAAAGQYQDVSQITAVQVTPRPKPRAFPRTNPAYVSTQRCDDGGRGSYKKVTELNHHLQSPQQQQQRLPSSTADVGRQAFYRPNNHHVAGGAYGVQTLQTTRTTTTNFGESIAAEITRSVFENDDDDDDSDDSSRSSTTSGETNGFRRRRRFPLDSKPNRHDVRDDIVVVDVCKGVSSLHRPSKMRGTATTSAFYGNDASADGGLAGKMSSCSPSPSGSGSPGLRSGDGGRESNGRRPHPCPSEPRGGGDGGGGGPGDEGKREGRSRLRRNSEPDYVNVPPGREQRYGSSTMRALKSSCESAVTASDLEDEAEEGSRNGGTLRVRDHASPANVPSDANLDACSSDRSSALSTPSPQLLHRRHPHPQQQQQHLPAETLHPSLRRRKWLEKPNAQQMRQSTLEKSLSLQAELAQQHRPLSMIVPFGSDGNAIVSQVADTILQQMDIERFVAENLNEHRKGILGKTVPISNMLVWSKDMIQKPMIRTENKSVKKEAVEVFKLIQAYMGDRKSKESSSSLAFELLNKGWSCPELSDEIYIQLCRQTTRNPREDSLLHGWELLGICLNFLPPSAKFQSYLEGHIYRTLDSRDHTSEGHIHNYAVCCHRRLDRIIQSGSKRRPSFEEIEHSKKSLLQPSMFGGTLESIMDLQKDRYLHSKLPWIQKILSDELLKLNEDQLTEGIFRVPGDTDEVNALKAKCDQWILPAESTDPHILASLLKLWYRELYEPLIPNEFYGRCVESYADAKAALQIVDELPELNRLVLSYLILFLQKFALPERAALTKMDANNLAMVMAPNCLRCQSNDPQILFNNARKEVEFMHQLIQNFNASHLQEIV